MPWLLSVLAERLGLTKAMGRLASVVGVIALLLAAWGTHEWHASTVVSEAREAGKSAERAAWIAERDEETRRRNAANGWARIEGEATVSSLRAENAALAQLIEDLSHEALADPGRDGLALLAGSVQRIAAIGRGGLCGARAPAGRSGRAPGGSGGAACRAMTRAEVEAAWIADRRALVDGKRRHGALAGWLAKRDAALAGAPLRLRP